MFASDIANDKVKNTYGVDKLLSINQALGSSMYISGANGRKYGVNECFINSGIDLKFHEFKPVKYPQLHTTCFIPNLSFFDTLFNKGLEWTEKQIKTELNLV